MGLSAFAASIVSPLELFKTRIQAADKEGIAGTFDGKDHLRAMYLIYNGFPFKLFGEALCTWCVNRDHLLYGEASCQHF